MQINNANEAHTQYLRTKPVQFSAINIELSQLFNTLMTSYRYQDLTHRGAPPVEPEVVADYITETVIPTFKGQAKVRNAQFAVLNLLSWEECMDDLYDVQFDPWPEVDPTQVSMPQKHQYNNYIVASYNGKRHAEKTLMRECQALFEGYEIENHHTTPACVLLYSKLMPCAKCASLIIDTLSQPPFENISGVIAYTYPYRKETEQVASSSRERFFKEGLQVYQVP